MKGDRNKEVPNWGQSSSGAGWMGCGRTGVRCKSCGDGGNVEIEREGCENNERYSDSNTRVRDVSVTFYHHTDNGVDGEVQGMPSQLCKCGGGMSVDCGGSRDEREMRSAD